MTILSKREAAQSLRVSERTIDNYRKRGIIKSISAGPGTKFVRFNAEDVKNIFKPKAN